MSEEHEKMKNTCVKNSVCKIDVCPLQCGNYKDRNKAFIEWLEDLHQTDTTYVVIQGIIAKAKEIL